LSLTSARTLQRFRKRKVELGEFRPRREGRGIGEGYEQGVKTSSGTREKSKRYWNENEMILSQLLTV